MRLVFCAKLTAERPGFTASILFFFLGRNLCSICVIRDKYGVELMLAVLCT